MDVRPRGLGWPIALTAVALLVWYLTHRDGGGESPAPPEPVDLFAAAAAAAAASKAEPLAAPAGTRAQRSVAMPNPSNDARYAEYPVSGSYASAPGQPVDPSRIYDGSGPYAPGCVYPAPAESCTGRWRELFLDVRENEWATDIELRLRRIWEETSRDFPGARQRIQCATTVCQVAVWVAPRADRNDASRQLAPFIRAVKASDLSQELWDDGQSHGYNVIAQHYARIIADN